MQTRMHATCSRQHNLGYVDLGMIKTAETMQLQTNLNESKTWWVAALALAEDFGVFHVAVSVDDPVVGTADSGICGYPRVVVQRVHMIRLPIASAQIVLAPTSILTL